MRVYIYIYMRERERERERDIPTLSGPCDLFLYATDREGPRQWASCFHKHSCHYIYIYMYTLTLYYVNTYIYIYIYVLTINRYTLLSSQSLSQKCRDVPQSDLTASCGKHCGNICGNVWALTQYMANVGHRVSYAQCCIHVTHAIS